LSTALGRPGAFLRAARLAWALGRNSDRGLLYHAFYLGEACVLRAWLARGRVDHLHAHFGTNSACVAMLCRELGGPKYSFTVHGPDEFDRPGLLGLPTKIAKADFVVGISNFGKSQLMRWSEFAHWKKIHVVHCGVDDKFLGEEPTPVPAARRLVCIGRLAGAKGQSLLVEAAARLKREGMDFEIVLAGSGPMHDELEELVARLDVRDRVKLLGWVSNQTVREELLAARAMVLPSFAEGLPVAVMESLAMGRPVIASRIAGTPELVEHGVSGWLVDAGSLESVTNALREALNAEPEQLTRMGASGRRRVQEHHDASREAMKLLSLMRALNETDGADNQVDEPQPPHSEAA
ncbi:MAG TPA: glycosyltransferase family 4 protein, partial [Polyangiaceae bacterium]